MKSISFKKILVIVFIVFTTSLAGAQTRVAYIAGVTGTDPNTARELARGIDVFKSLHKQSSKSIDIKVFDNEGSVEKTLAVMELAYNDGFKFFVGVSNSNEAMAAAKFISMHKDTFFITPFATNSKITQVSDRIFRICYDDSAQGKFLAKFVQNTLRSKRAMILTNIESLYSQDLAENFTKNLKKVITQKYDYIITELDAGKDISKLIATAKSFNPDVVFIPDSSQNTAKILKILYSELPSVHYVGGDGWGGQTLFQAIFPVTPKMKLSYSTYWDSEISINLNKKFINAYSKLYGGDKPTSGAALSYESLYILADAIKSQGLKSVSNIEAIKTFLYSKTFKGTTGDIKFSKDNGTPARQIVIMSIGQDSKFHPQNISSLVGSK